MTRELSEITILSRWPNISTEVLIHQSTKIIESGRIQMDDCQNHTFVHGYILLPDAFRWLKYRVRTHASHATRQRSRDAARRHLG
eukprot:3944195-Pleurochrysis_carterae.AAC.1